MRNLKLFSVGLAALAALGPARADINIGVILSLTGPAASLGMPARNSIALWPQEIAGQKLVVTVLDDGSDATASTLAARKLTAETKVDIIVGPSVTPPALAVLQVAGETQTPMVALAGGGAIVTPMDGPRRWAFKMPPAEEIPLKMIFASMKKKNEKNLAIVAMSNPYGQTFLDVAKQLSADAGIQIVDVERYGATDTSFVSQALKLLSTKPDAVLIVAAGTPAAMPQIELKSRGFAGTVFQTQAVANADFLRVGGTSVYGTLMPVSPLLVAEQLPANNPIRQVAMSHVEKYEGKYGAGSRSLFGGTAWDVYLLIEHALPAALKEAKPGTAQFRLALRDALEKTRNLTLTEGVYSMSASDHNGADQRSQVMVRIEDGKWRLVD